MLCRVSLQDWLILVTFEAAEGEALNITDKENNPMVNQLVEAIENQE